MINVNCNCDNDYGTLSSGGCANCGGVKTNPPTQQEGQARYELIRRELAIECVSQLWSNENAGFREELKSALEE